MIERAILADVTWDRLLINEHLLFCLFTSLLVYTLFVLATNGCCILIHLINQFSIFLVT